MRVISGSAKGRNLKPVPGDTTRPITDRVKEALFNILSADVIDARFLDLFGGTGAVGIEALSRGAAQCTFIEKSRVALDVIKDNLETTKLLDRAALVRSDSFTYLANAPQSFHYIYIAPPQYERLWIKAIELIDAQPTWLADDGEIIVQIHPKEYEELVLTNFEQIDERKYGSTLLVFYEHKETV